MMKTLLVTTALLLTGLVAQAQPHMSFTEAQHNFGQIHEEKGRVSHTFTFTNTGTDTLIISAVNASCGCTTPSWTQEAVPPGDSGTITAVYNPYNRPGRFNKPLTVRSNADPQVMILRISGIVVPKPEANNVSYPTDLGGLRVQSQYLQMGTITTEKPIAKEFPVFNTTAEPLWLLDTLAGPDYLSARFFPDTLLPRSTGKLVVTYDPTEDYQLGYQPASFQVMTNQLRSPEKSFVLLVTVEEFFPQLTEEELAQAPRLSAATRYYDLGNLDQGDSATTTFALQNTGKQTLNIREVRPNCGCLEVAIPTMDLAPGATTELSVTFKSEGRRGIQNKSVTLFTNDPRNPTQEVKVKAVVSVRE